MAGLAAVQAETVTHAAKLLLRREAAAPKQDVHRGGTVVSQIAKLGVNGGGRGFGGSDSGSVVARV